MTKMMRTLTSLVAAGALFFVAGSAQALSTVSLEWNLTGGNSNVLDVNADTCDTTGIIRASFASPDVCVANVLLTVDTRGIAVLGVSFVWDQDLGNEANFVGGFEGSITDLSLAGKGNAFFGGTFGMTLAAESNGAQGGFARLFDMSASNPPAGVGITTTNSGGLAVTVGTIAFSINAANATTDGADILVGTFDGGFDGGGTSNNVITALAGGSLEIVPEPTTTALMVLGLVGLGYVGRRSIR